PDIALIQGVAGTGKSRVLVEIISQAAKRGDRVLFVAAHPEALDVVLERIAQRTDVCPLRCVAPDENAQQLPLPIRALTLPERWAALRQQSLTSARESRQT